MSDTNQPAQAEPAYRTAAEIAALDGAVVPAETQGDARNGLTRVLGLREIDSSTAPSRFDGKPVPHVMGPGVNPGDPVAMGLDTRLIGVDAGLNRVMTQTGEAGSGMRPYTYVQHTGPEMVPQTAPADGQHVAVEAPQVKDTGPVPPAASKVSDQPVPTNGGAQTAQPAAKPAAQSAPPQPAPAAKPAQ